MAGRTQTGRLFLDLWKQKALLYELTKREIRQAYFGSALGLGWAFVEPMIYIGVMALFLRNKLNLSPAGDHPMFSWLISGMVVWTFFSSVLMSGVNIFSQYSYMLRKPGYNLAVLPVVKIGAALFIHLIMLGLLTMVLLLNGVMPSWMWLQLPYYLGATCFLAYSCTLLVGSLNLFLKDVRNVVGVIVQVGIWVTPIFWSAKGYSEKIGFLVRLNPLYHLVEGYRRCFIYGQPVWDAPGVEFYSFWLFSLTLYWASMKIFGRLRVHFGDVIK